VDGCGRQDCLRHPALRPVIQTAAKTSFPTVRRRSRSLFEWFIGTTPLCDSSQTYTRAVRPGPSPADLLSGLAAGVSEVSRFSCMKFLGVPWRRRPRRTEQELALSLPSLLPSPHFYRVGVRLVTFRGSIPTPPILYLRSTSLREVRYFTAKWLRFALRKKDMRGRSFEEIASELVDLLSEQLNALVLHPAVATDDWRDREQRIEKLRSQLQMLRRAS